MKQLITFIFILFQVSVFSQSEIKWFLPQARDFYYPRNVYVTGFAQVGVDESNKLTHALQQVQKNAQVNLSQNLNLKIKNITKTINIESETDNSIISKGSYNSEAILTTDSEITGMNYETYYDKEKNIVYGFAYVEISQLLNYHIKQIAFNKKKVEQCLILVQRYESQKDKSNAKKECKDAQTFLQNIEYSIKSLLAIGEKNIDAIQEEYYNLNKAVNNCHTVGDASIYYVLLIVEEDNFGKKTNILSSKLKSKMAKDFKFVNTIEDADFVILAKVNTRFGHSNEQIVCAFADIEIELSSTQKKGSLYSDTFSQNGGSTNIQNAGRSALEEGAEKMYVKIIEYLK